MCREYILTYKHIKSKIFTMAESDESFKSLLENDFIRQKVSCFIQEEVVESEWPDPNDQHSNFLETCSIVDQQKTDDQKKSKPLNEEQKKNKNGAKSAYSNVCGFTVNVKQLLENEGIRKQVAPFIEKQVIIPVWSDDASDNEELDFNDIDLSSEKDAAEDEEENEKSKDKSVQIKDELDSDSTISIDTDVVENENDKIIITSDTPANHNLSNSNIIKNKKSNVNDLLPVMTESAIPKILNNVTVLDKAFKNNSLLHIPKKIKVIKKRRIKLTPQEDPRKRLKPKIMRNELHRKIITNKSIKNIKEQVCQIAKVTEKTVESAPINPASDVLNVNDKAIDNQVSSIIKEETILPDGTIIDSATFNKSKDLDIEKMPIMSGDVDVINSVNLFKHGDSDIETMPIVACDVDVIETVISNEHKDFGMETVTITSNTTCNENDLVDPSENKDLVSETVPFEVPPNVSDVEKLDSVELQPVKSEIESSDEQESEINYHPNIQNSTNDTSITNNNQINDSNSNNENCEWQTSINNKELKKLPKRRWLVKRRRTRYLRGCLKCGKKYKRFIMLRKHESKCIDSKVYECAMCSYKTHDQDIFKEHLENHILGNFSTDLTAENDNTSQIQVKSEIKTEEGWKYIRLSQCPKCDWCNSDDVDDDFNDRGEVDNDRCNKCSADLLVYQPISTDPDYLEHENCSSSMLNLPCQDKVPYVRLIRLPNTNSTPSTLPAPPPLYRIPTSTLPNNSMSASTSTSQQLEKPHKSPKKSGNRGRPKRSISKKKIDPPLDYNLIEPKEEPLDYEESTNLFAYTGNDNDTFNDKVNDHENVNDYQDSSNKLKRQRTLKSSEWIQWFCQKCDAIQNSENFEVEWKNQSCKKCKAKLLYLCLKCDGTFDTYYTIAYHLRYCCTQAEKKRRRSNKPTTSISKSPDSKATSSKKVQKHVIKKLLKCPDCEKVFHAQINLKKHKAVCRFKKIKKTSNARQDLPESSDENFVYVLNDRKIPVFQVNRGDQKS